MSISRLAVSFPFVRTAGWTGRADPAALDRRRSRPKMAGAVSYDAALALMDHRHHALVAKLKVAAAPSDRSGAGISTGWL